MKQEHSEKFNENQLPGVYLSKVTKLAVFTTRGPPPPPPISRMAVKSNVRLAGPPPPPPMSNKAFTSSGSSPLPMVPIKMSAKIFSSHKSSQVLEKCGSIPSSASIPTEEPEVIIAEKLKARNATLRKKKKAMPSYSKSLKEISQMEEPDIFRKIDQDKELLEAEQKKQTEHAKKIPVSRKRHGMRVIESIEGNTEELFSQRSASYPGRSSGGSCCPSTATYENTRNGRALHVDGRWVQDKERLEELCGFLSKVKDKSGGKTRSLNGLTDREPDLADVGSKMPIIAKAAMKNLSKKEFDILKKIQNQLGGWTRDELEKDLYIDLSACIEVLNTAGLKSLGVKVAMEIDNVLVTAFVVMWILKTLAPELFPLDTTARNWSQTAVEIAAAVLEIYDHDRSLLDKAVQYCDQVERAHPGVAYTLELGSNWFNVASKILGF